MIGAIRTYAQSTHLRRVAFITMCFGNPGMQSDSVLMHTWLPYFTPNGVSSQLLTIPSVPIVASKLRRKRDFPTPVGNHDP